MPRPEVVIEVSSNPRLAQDLAAGGVFVPGYAYRLNDECELLVRCEAAELRLLARVVYSQQDSGTGFELVEIDEPTKAQLGTMIGKPLTIPVRRAPSSVPTRHPTPPVGRRKISTPPAAVPVVPEAVAEPEPVVEPVEARSEDSSPAIVISSRPVEDDPPVHTERFTLEDELESAAPTEPPSEPEATNAARAEPEKLSLELDPLEDEPASQELAPDIEAQLNKASGGADAKFARNIHERMRGLNLQQQIKMAQSGRDAERIILERMYGKNVWEALLRNPRITGPEVARIARMGALPRPMIEVICGNGGWLQIPEIRRALLTNPRLGTDQIMKVLRLTPKAELRVVPMQTAYPHAVRDVARRLLRASP